MGGTGDHQWRARFIDQNRIHFINYGKTEAALGFIILTQGHIVAQIVETKFIVGAISNISGVGFTATAGSQGLVTLIHDKRVGAIRSLIGLDYTHRESQSLIQRCHPLGVATGQVIIYRDHMHPFTGQCIEVGGQCGNQCFTFTGAHFSNAALVQCHATDHLHIEVAHAHDSAGGLADQSEGFRQQIVQITARFQLLAQTQCAGLEVGITKLGQGRF